MENNIIKERHTTITHLAELLHRWHCKEDHGHDWQDGDNKCTFLQESWEPLTEGGVRQVFYDKAARVHEFYTEPEDCLKFLKFLQIVNPKLCIRLIEEL